MRFDSFLVLVPLIFIFMALGIMCPGESKYQPTSEELRLENLVAKAQTAQVHRKIWQAYKGSPLAEKAFFLISDWLLARINCATSGGEIQGFLIGGTHEYGLLVELKVDRGSNYSTWLKIKMDKRIDQVLKRAKERIAEFEIQALEKELEVANKK